MFDLQVSGIREECQGLGGDGGGGGGGGGEQEALPKIIPLSKNVSDN